jgi:DDE_Tnp_1-associated
MDQPTVAKYFSSLEDPRMERTRQHSLHDILVIAICGIICGADDWVSIEEFGEAKLSWFKTFLELPNGIPSHDTFGRVFAALDPQTFRRCFTEWVASIADLTKGEGTCSPLPLNPRMRSCETWRHENPARPRIPQSTH